MLRSLLYPQHHKQDEVGSIYACTFPSATALTVSRVLPNAERPSRCLCHATVAASTHGVFVNIALQEPFGLTLIEAAAHGLPTVATRHGGPVEIHATLNNGLLVRRWQRCDWLPCMS
jgi:glycosyltransferase involved in cell wall biosynthesis